MPICFVIQPFDRGRYDKRFEDVFRPAIEQAGLEPYRVDQDPLVEIPIEAIEEGIRNAAICLVDISTDNPNVWYELGYAYAAGKAVIMLCSDERIERRYPFDIQHRTVVEYKTESPRDFNELIGRIKERIQALMKKGERLRELAESDPIAHREGLSQAELAVLAALAGEALMPETKTSIYSLKHDVERAGFTSLGFGLGLRRLIKKGLVESTEGYDEQENYSYPAAMLTLAGWDWIEGNESMFSLKKAGQINEEFSDEAPF
jgi:nucleoside 2-deoxyribosyltransferase